MRWLRNLPVPVQVVSGLGAVSRLKGFTFFNPHLHMDIHPGQFLLLATWPFDHIRQTQTADIVPAANSYYPSMFVCQHIREVTMSFNVSSFPYEYRL